eukprot:scaffold894_cov153-Cylindrotheca_fusiformis.AAC.18
MRVRVAEIEAYNGQRFKDQRVDSCAISPPSGYENPPSMGKPTTMMALSCYYFGWVDSQIILPSHTNTQTRTILWTTRSDKQVAT